MPVSTFVDVYPPGGRSPRRIAYVWHPDAHMFAAIGPVLCGRCLSISPVPSWAHAHVPASLVSPRDGFGIVLCLPHLREAFAHLEGIPFPEIYRLAGYKDPTTWLASRLVGGIRQSGRTTALRMTAVYLASMKIDVTLTAVGGSKKSRENDSLVQSAKNIATVVGGKPAYIAHRVSYETREDSDIHLHDHYYWRL